MYVWVLCACVECVDLSVGTCGGRRGCWIQATFRCVINVSRVHYLATSWWASRLFSFPSCCEQSGHEHRMSRRGQCYSILSSLSHIIAFRLPSMVCLERKEYLSCFFIKIILNFVQVHTEYAGRHRGWPEGQRWYYCQLGEWNAEGGTEKLIHH